jgi:hypothetical protein
MAKKKVSKKKTAKKTSKKKEVDPVVEQVNALRPKCEKALKQARELMEMRFAGVDSVFRHRLDCETQRNVMEKAGAGYLAFQALLELTRDVNRLSSVPVDCEDLNEEFKKLVQ